MHGDFDEDEDPDFEPDIADRKAVLHTDGWGSRQQQSCLVVGETAKRYRVRALPGSELRLPRRGNGVLRILSSGTYLVPKTAITFEAERR